MFLGVANLGQCTAWAVSSPRSVLCQDGSAVAPLRYMDSRVLKDFALFPFWFDLPLGSILGISFQLAHLPHVVWWYFFFFFTDAVSVLLTLSGYVALPDVKHLRSLFETITKLHDRRQLINFYFVLARVGQIMIAFHTVCTAFIIVTHHYPLLAPFCPC